MYSVPARGGTSRPENRRQRCRMLRARHVTGVTLQVKALQRTGAWASVECVHDKAHLTAARADLRPSLRHPRVARARGGAAARALFGRGAQERAQAVRLGGLAREVERGGTREPQAWRRSRAFA